MKRKYRFKISLQLLRKMKRYWEEFEVAENEFYERIGRIEEKMAKDTGIEDIGFIHDSMCMGWIGIGNGSRTMPLIQREELK